MRWALDAEHLMLQNSLGGWLSRVATPAAVRGWLDAADPTTFDSALADEGWFALGSSEERGGQGGGLLELALVAEQLARVAAPSAAWMATVLALPALSDAEAESALENGTRLALAVRADRPVSLEGRVPLVDGTVSGEIPFVLGGDRADRFVVPTDDGLAIVEAPSARITPTTLLDRSRTAATVSFDRSPATALDADAGEFLATAANRSAVLISADALGAASRMLQLAVEYSMQRTQFGVQIGSFQAVKHTAATMLVAEEASRSLVYYAAASVDAGLPDSGMHAAAAKAQVTAAAAESAEGALTVHGAIGYTWEHDLQLFYKRAKLDLSLFGAPAAWNEVIADGLQLVTSA